MRDTGKVNHTIFFFGHGPLTLEHLDGDGGLVVAVGDEGLSLLGGDDTASEVSPVRMVACTAAP